MKTASYAITALASWLAAWTEGSHGAALIAAVFTLLAIIEMLDEDTK